MDERAAFERAIDENPLDATTHRVYADWLDDNGHSDEAAFRRSMGDWIQDRQINTHEFIPGHTHYGTYSPSRRDEVDDSLPKGVRHKLISTVNLNSVPLSDLYFPLRPGVRDRLQIPPETAEISDVISGQHWWPTYRGMEGAMRRAFKPVTKLSRKYRRNPVRRFT